MKLNVPTYTPIIKSTDAELRGFGNLSNEIKGLILPVFELTRSRTSKNSPDGNIHKRMQQISDIVEKLPFVLDLTSHEDLLNEQIKDLFDESGGFKNWVDFLSEYKESNIIPAIHMYEDTEQDLVHAEIDGLLKSHDKLALRVEADDNQLINYLETIRSGLDSDDQLLLIIDYGFVESSNVEVVVGNLMLRLSELPDGFTPWAISICGSSFPSSVVNHTSDCHDAHGEIKLVEKQVFSKICENYKNTIYGDFASVHPVRYDTRGGGWVPRVDFSLSDSIIYKRYRRNIGGYEEAASEMVNDSRYEDLKCWGNDEIESAANGSPNGLSPSFWIAVRMNTHLTRHAKILAAKK